MSHLFHWLYLNVFGNLVASVLWSVPTVFYMEYKNIQRHKEHLRRLK